MKIFNALVLLLAVFYAPYIHADDTYSTEVGQFEKLKVNSNVKVIYRNLPDSIGMARYTGDEDISKVFIFTNKGKGTLRIQLAQTQWNRKEAPLLYVYSDFLSDVESSSDQSVIIEDMPQCASFNVNLIGNGEIIVENVKCMNLSAKISTGNGTVSISGKCTNASFQMIGAGQILADRLQSENVKCKILGTGSIGCWPIDNLNVAGIGTTKIYYKGHPNIKKTGGGRLFELPDSGNNFPKTGAEVKSFNNLNNNDEEAFEEDEEDYYNGKTVVTEDD